MTINPVWAYAAMQDMTKRHNENKEHTITLKQREIDAIDSEFDKMLRRYGSSEKSSL